jgi:hypothetical protein
MKTIFGGQLDFENNVELDVVLENLNPQLAIRIIELGIEKSLSEGVFDLTESHCLYMCLNHLKNIEIPKKV